MTYEVRLTTTQTYNGGIEYYEECEVRETPSYLEVYNLKSHSLGKTRFIHPWGTILRAMITELPAKTA